MPEAAPKKPTPTSTVGRGKAVKIIEEPSQTEWKKDNTSLYYGDSLDLYKDWEKPTTIISDGAYGVLGFEGDTSDHLDLPEWYEPHVKSWSKSAMPQTTLWFWNSEIGWAVIHPILEKYGWRYVNANSWNKGKGHIAGNVNTAKIRRFPVVTEVCVQYVFEAQVNGMTLKKWLHSEWKRAGLPLCEANKACEVANVATRKYLDQGHLWYYPPVEMFEKMQSYANTHGDPLGRPYFSLDGKNPATAAEWDVMRSKFHCPHGYTNVWERSPLNGKERVRVENSQKAVHLNQKPLDLMELIIKASSDEGDVIWEPFGGLFSACVAARNTNRKAYGAEIDSTYFQYGLKRFIK